MAKGNGEAKAVVEAWSKGQKMVEEAGEKLKLAQSQTQGFAKRIYEALGTEPFYVKALGRKYRALHKKARTNDKGTEIPETWMVIPIAENEAKHEY